MGEMMDWGKKQTNQFCIGDPMSRGSSGQQLITTVRSGDLLDLTYISRLYIFNC